MLTLHHQFGFTRANIRLEIKQETDTWPHHHHYQSFLRYQNSRRYIHRGGAYYHAHHPLNCQRKEHSNQVEWKSIQVSLFIILFRVDALSNRTREQYLSASLPKSTVVKAGKSILQFIPQQPPSSTTSEPYKNALSPTVIEESAEQSILHFSSLSITLKLRQWAFHKGFVSKWNGGECWQVYSSFHFISIHSQTLHRNNASMLLCQMKWKSMQASLFLNHGNQALLSNTTTDAFLKEYSPIATDFKLGKSIPHDHELKSLLNSNEASRKQPIAL